MRKFLPVPVVLLVLAGARADDKPGAPKPPAPIDGKYTLLATSAPSAKSGFGGPSGDSGFGATRPGGRAETVITRNEIIIESRTSTMDYTIDTTKTPMTIDVEITTARGKKSKSLGIVETNGNRLTMALAKEGAERPKTTEEVEGVTVYYFLKAPPPPRVEYKIVAMTVGKETEAEKELNKLAQEGFELVSTTTPAAPDGKSSPTTVHFVLKRTVK